MNDTEKIVSEFEKAYKTLGLSQGISHRDYLRMFCAFAEGWKAKPVNKIGRPKGKAAPKSKKAKES